MNIPAGIKPGLYGAAIGAVAVAIVGFSWGGWVTGGTAEQMASDHAKLEVVAALVPICLEQSKQDPGATATMAELEAASDWKRSDMLMGIGWATMPGAEDANRDVARACMEELAGQF